MRVLLALLLAYIPSAGSLLKHTAQRARALGKTRDVTLSGNLSVGSDPQRTAQLVLRFPLQCRLEGEGGLSLSVKGTAQNPEGVPEGSSGPALRMLQLSCAFLAYRGVPVADAPQTLQAAARAAGADVGAGAGLSRLSDQATYVLGASPRDSSSPQLWLYKDNWAPARLIAQGGVSVEGARASDPNARLAPGVYLLKVGKRKFTRVTVK